MEVNMEFRPVIFSVNGQKFAVNISCVSGIEKVQNIVGVPNSNKDIKGIINLRGEVIPIYSLRRHFNMPDAEYTESSQFVIVYTDDIRIGLEVDSVEEIHKVEEGMIVDVPVIIKNDETQMFDKVINIGGELVLVINIEKILKMEQMEDIKQLVENK